MNTRALIQLNDVSFSYDIDGNTLEVLKDINLFIHQGEHVAIIGHNGSGKSTLSKLLNGLFVPKNGRVLVNGMETSETQNLQSIRQTVGVVFQHPDNQMIATIVEDDVAFGLENLRISRDEMKQRVKAALENVGLLEHRSRPPHHLSGGQKQRAALAGVLAMRPSCIVLDEATSMLDPAGKKEILSIILDLHSKGMTLVNITHHLSEAVLADRLIVLDQGRIVLDDSPKKILSDVRAVRDYRLDIPFAAKVSAALNQKYPLFPPDLLFNDEVVSEILNLSSLVRKEGAL